MQKGTMTVIIIAVVSLLVVGAAAAVYFLVLNKKAATPQEEVVLRYFDALSSGDTATLQSLFVPGQGLSDMELQLLKGLGSMGLFKFEDIKLETGTVTGTDATVLLKGYTVTVTAGGQTSSIDMKDNFGSNQLAIQEKNVNGKWLIVKQATMPGIEIPSLPGGVTPSQ
jgi:hypothetical protein